MLNVILVMIERELKLFFSSKSRVFATIVFPIILTYILKIIFQNQNVLGINMNELVITGIVISAIAVYSLFSGMSIIWERKIGFMKELLVAPVSKFSILIGKILGISIISLIIGLIIIFTNPINISLCGIIFMFLTSLIFTPLGLFLAFKVSDFEDFSNLVYIFLVPLILFSGVISPIQSLNFPFNILAYIDILTYPLDGFRACTIGKSVFNPIFDFIIGFFIFLLFLYLAKIEFEKSEERV